MDVLNEIIQNSAIGSLSKVYKSIVLLLFSTIVAVLMIMLVYVILNGSQLTFNFGY
ncbi:hypothetical protein GGR42_000319 [Saonia flava]|uniref:Uncharacterized protein n=1 Tax=Saonia flava TaxID=523696 RepID=A0A846QRN5_9FLAO|nr:hypothetical protein [Saonia flava]NJB69857.1 hypothetical protein [Saonia flava]